MNVKAKKLVKYRGQWLRPGMVFECGEKEVIAQLEVANAIERTTQTRTLTPSEELQQVNGVSKEIAETLINSGAKRFFLAEAGKAR